MKLTKLGIGALVLLFSMNASAAVTYTYDSLNRLTGIDYGNGTSQAYSYDAGGNLLNITTQGTPAGSLSQTISFGAAPAVGVGGIGAVSATATSGLVVTFSSTTPSVCTVSGNTVTGLTLGTCTIAANQTGNANYAAAPQVTQNIAVTSVANGACGSANWISTAFAPSANLCSSGYASAVTTGSTWTWSCAGSGGGANANCSAPNETIPTSTGSGHALISGGTWAVNQALSSGFIATAGDPSGKSPPNLPSGYTFPYGLFDFTLNTGTAGSAATITITYPAALPPGTVYWKYGPSPAGYNCSGAACTAAHWYQMPPAQAVISGNTVTLTIFDGGVGDDDLQANSIIVDQGGPGFPAATGIPTLSQWGMMLLSGLLALGSLVTLRRQRL